MSNENKVVMDFSSGQEVLFLFQTFDRNYCNSKHNVIGLITSLNGKAHVPLMSKSGFTEDKNNYHTRFSTENRLLAGQTEMSRVMKYNVCYSRGMVFSIT